MFRFPSRPQRLFVDEVDRVVVVAVVMIDAVVVGMRHRRRRRRGWMTFLSRRAATLFAAMMSFVTCWLAET
jgi:hypothetical protein